MLVGIFLNFLKNLFEWGDPEEPFSIGKMVTDVIDNIFSWFGKIFDIDVGAIFKDMLGGLGKAGAWLAGKLGLGPDTKESLEEELAIAKKGVNIKGRQKVDKAKVAEIEAKLEKFATGGTILPGGTAIVGEAGPEIVVSASPAKVIPANQSADIMAGIGGGQNFAPTTIVNSAPVSTTMIANSSSHNPYSDKYFRN